MARTKKNTENRVNSPTFIVKLEKGLAERQRLPLDHVIRVLEEVRQMIIDAGREIQSDLGMERPTAEFGLELVAGPQGILFKAGSVQAEIAITSNAHIGVLAAKRVVDTVGSLSKKKFQVVSETDRSIVRRLNRINQMRETDKTELRLVLTRPGTRKPAEAIFNETAAATAWSLQAPVFEIEGMTVYGKLFELRDTEVGDEEKRGFWGELRRDNGEVWRIKFRREDLDKAAGLFRAQVMVTGRVKYYRIATPMLMANDIRQDKERDYEAAFDELFGCDRELYGDDFGRALKEMRGDA